MEDYIIKIKDLKKKYKLGTIGTGYLTYDIQNFFYNLRNKKAISKRATSSTNVATVCDLDTCAASSEIAQDFVISATLSETATASTVQSSASAIAASSANLANSETSSLSSVNVATPQDFVTSTTMANDTTDAPNSANACELASVCDLDTFSKHKNKDFYALDGINLQIKKGERLGIIGTNGAGKSTLLKLLSRVTSPTDGEIEINGRLSSMLEVGTGFHGELTGRENIYLSGAILGMSKKEVDSKIQSIVEFSECEKFIDTPVKRYSSGMYVKLAFSVAAHLDSEILIMDEVLAVGDVAFQKKCLEKMNQLSSSENRTILYVSHNMSTIRMLCTRCIVLNKGKLIFDGDVESAIEKYSNINTDMRPFYDFTNRVKDDFFTNYNAEVKSIEFLNNQSCFVEFGESVKLKVKFKCKKDVNDVHFQLIVKKLDGTACGAAFSNGITNCKAGNEKTAILELDTSNIAPGKYSVSIILFHPDGFGSKEQFDLIKNAMFFEVICSNNQLEHSWHDIWGQTVYNKIFAKEV